MCSSDLQVWMPDQQFLACACANHSPGSNVEPVCWGAWCDSSRGHPAFSHRCTSPGHPTSSYCHSMVSFRRSTVSSRRSTASFLPSSGPMRDHHFSDAGCCRRPLDLGQELLPDPNHTGNPAGHLFSCFDCPGDRFAGPICPGLEQDTSCQHRPGSAKAVSDHRVHSYPLSPLFRPRWPASPSGVSARAWSHVGIPAQTMQWLVIQSLLHRSSGSCSTG